MKMRKTKYIVGKLNSSNCTTAVVFDELINHSDMRCHFSEYSFPNVKKLYLDSIKKIDLSRFPNVEYLSLNSIQNFENSGISNKDELPVSLKFLSPLTLKKYRHLQKHL